MQEYGTRRHNYMCLQSLSATDGLTWDTVEFDKPETWANWEKELQEVGFTTFDINRVIGGIYEANGLDDNKVEEARQRFLASQRAKAEFESHQRDEPDTTESGASVNDSE